MRKLYKAIIWVKEDLGSLTNEVTRNVINECGKITSHNKGVLSITLEPTQKRVLDQKILVNLLNDPQILVRFIEVDSHKTNDQTRCELGFDELGVINSGRIFGKVDDKFISLAEVNYKRGKVNWPSIGAQSIEVAEVFTQVIDQAVIELYSREDYTQIINDKF